MSLLLDEDQNTIAMELTGRDYISYSSISLFQSCPLKWYYRYVLGLEEETVSSSLVFGSAIHKAVEVHFQELLAGNPPPDINMLLSAYQDSWHGRDQDRIRFGKNEDIDSLGQLAERMLAVFQQSEFALPNGKIIGVEDSLRGHCADDCPDLLAYVDLMMDVGENLVITDLKTSRNRWSQSQITNSSEQLLLYSVLAEKLVVDKPIQLQFAVITKTKNPTLEIHTVELDSQRIERTKQMVKRTWQAIRSRNYYPTSSPMSCGSCAFQEPCSQWSG